MAQGPARQFGVTPPISMALPTDAENKMNNLLIEELKAQGSFESPEESEKRVKVLNEIQKMTEEFVKTVSMDKGMTEQMAKDCGGKIFTYGSYRLGVYGPGSDIDTLVVVPRHITREDFFKTFDKMLRARPEVDELSSVPDAYVPIIKMEFSGISIDLIFARLAIPQVPLSLELDDNNLLRNVDERDVLSLNGTRVTDDILRLVPNPSVFKHALRTIKLWAQRRAIYSNVLGFPGGVAWAMLTARICQLYPNAISATIVSKFFRIYTQWSWPQPVMLKPIEDGPLQVRVWNPKIYPHDRLHKMPIITPAYPSMCATHNITDSTKKVIIAELERAGDVADKIMIGRAPWSDLFAKHTFFHNYKHYLCVTAFSKTKEQHLKWNGLVESRVRQLVMKLEMVEQIGLAHPYVKGFDRVYYAGSEEEASTIVDGEIPANVLCEAADLSAELPVSASSDAPKVEKDEDGRIKVYTTSFYLGLEVVQQDGQAPKKLDISWSTTEFYEFCKRWDKYDPECMNVRVKYMRSFDLPDDVYAPGEERPARPEKKTKKGGKKRALNADHAGEVGMKRVRSGETAQA
ncbi:polynucleotide adenylyltransferase [Saitoella coloradoensis]